MASKLTIHLLVFTILSLCSCKVPSRMFRTDSSINSDSVSKTLHSFNKNYLIQPNDYLFMEVYTNAGERIIDPNSEMQGEMGQKPEKPRYLVRPDGNVTFPLIGDVNLRGKTVHQADSILNEKFLKFYQNPFVITKLANKRIIVIGPLGAKVLLLENENINVIEAIAMYGGIGEGKAKKIRRIRGESTNPDVQIIDLSTIEGMTRSDLSVEPNDVIYIEPVSRFSEKIREITPVFSILTSVMSIVIILTTRLIK